MIPLAEQNQLKQRFARELISHVWIEFFSQRSTGIYLPGRIEHIEACTDVRKLLREVAALSPNISLREHEYLDREADLADSFAVELAPAIVLRGPENRPLSYCGNPRQKQFLVFIEMLLMVASGRPSLKPETLKALNKVSKDVVVRVFVAPECAFSTSAAITALRLALANSHVQLGVYDVTTFTEVIKPLKLQATPLTVLNDRYAIAGTIDEAVMADNLLKVSQGSQPARGGVPNSQTPLTVPAPQPPGPRTTPGGLILPS